MSVNNSRGPHEVTDSIGILRASKALAPQVPLTNQAFLNENLLACYRGATMTYPRMFSQVLIAFCPLLLPMSVRAQGTLADYQRAATLRAKYQAAALNIPETPNWVDGSHFWYRKSVAGGHAFVMVDASTAANTAAFDHGKLAISLSKVTGENYTSVT